MSKKKKIRVAFRKNRENKSRRMPQLDAADVKDLTEHVADLPTEERISGKGKLTRYRTVVTSGEETASGGPILRDVDLSTCLEGRVISPRGGDCLVQGPDGKEYLCVIRRVLKTLSIDERNAVVAGDRVLFKPTDDSHGFVERVEPRRATLSRYFRRQRHVLVANVDQVLIVSSAADPGLKPSLIDRYLITARLGGMLPILCINKADLVERADLQPIAGLYAQLGCEVVIASTVRGWGISRLKHLLRDRETVLAGQSGVGKSSLINAVEQGLNLRTSDVSEETGKGRHTTSSANLLKLSGGGWVVDTPGIRQLDLWDVIPEQVEGYFVEFHPFVRNCRFPDCSHTHEQGCGVKRAVVRGLIPAIRYESYCRIRLGDSG